MRVKYVIFLFAILFAACTKESNRLFIKGKVANYSKSYVLFAYDSIGCGLSFNVDTIKIDTNGSFAINKDRLLSNAFLLFEDAKPIRLTLSRSLNQPISINLDCTKPDSIQFEGEQAAFLKFDLAQMRYWTKIFQEMSKKHPELGSGNNQNPLYFVIQDSITQLRIQYLDKYFADSNITGKEDFISNERNSLVYSNLYYRMSVPENKIIEQLAFYQNPNDKSANSLTYSKEVSFSDDNLFEINYYQKFMNDFIMKAVRKENPQGNFSSYELYLDKGLAVIDKWFKKPQTNFKQKIIFMNHLISTATMFKAPVNIDQFQAEIEKLRKSENAGKYLSIVNDNLKKLKESMSKFSIGTRAPNFELKNSNGKVFHLSDFKNKIIFIDVWASWCGPCVANIPEWNDLVEKYSGNNEFQFLSVSIDDNVSDWAKAEARFKPNGLKLIADLGGFKSVFAKSFEINVIPAYISIDKEGNILSFSSSISDLQEIITKKN
jgi:thiol-disulfide isomerase/thioredoxin